ncbi:MAG TPA: DegT/DnrJ/EryC1/StrS family aminotransferase [Candidatus Saccharimonadales bacterium]|nr:DegT/DnrJ/EryC1/StrS family aminotransferase [Candidatus Saccharimonadales bacterium]
MHKEKINVTKTFLPPAEEYAAHLEGIWSRGWLTNQGPLVRELEKKVGDYLGLPELHFVSNGTVALQLALKALDIEDGEIITTPFSYVATTSAIMWERCKPVYVDIRRDTLCIDADKIEAAITPSTRAILAVHVFGQPCDVDKIAAIAKKHDLKVIYDGAHAFGAVHKGKALLSYGDIATGSFHSTKLFHTVEGGCVITHDKATSDKVELLKRFGHEGDTHHMLGINAKASEFHAAMGLCNLKYIDEIIHKRKSIHELYHKLLRKEIKKIEVQKETQHNYAYYPVIVDSEEQLHKIVGDLNKENIFPRRYFYPSLNKLSYVNSEHGCPVSEDIASRILCLPLYHDLADETVHRVSSIINNAYEI